MQFMASSLGVECGYCHVEGHFEKDDKKLKQTAREMMKMMAAINASSFTGRREVTCYSCHRGSPKPVATPILESGMQPNPRPAASETQQLPTNLPTADVLLNRYVEALGGAAAIQKITSRVEKGATDVRGKSVSVEIFTQSPEKWALVRHLPEGNWISTFDGHAGWISSRGRPTYDMRRSDVEAARMDADVQFPLHIREMFPELRVEYPENMGERQAYVLIGVREGHPAVKFCFDEQSGLLVRVLLYSESPLGLDPSQIDYADYREVDGVQVSFRRKVSQPENISIIQLQEVRQNVMIDAAIFAKPEDHPDSGAAPAQFGNSPKHR
jgi:hypothetical protein